MPEQDKSKIEDIKRHLYDPSDKTMGHQMEGVLHQVNHKYQEEWKDEEIKKIEEMQKTRKPKMSGFKKFFITSVIFFVAALGFALYKFSFNNASVSNEKIEINIIGNSFTKGGDELPLQVEITNKNNASLELTNLIVEYPKGAEDSVQDVVRLPRDPIGIIKPNETVIRNIKVKLFGEEKSVRNIKFSLEYHPEGSNAIFTKDKFYPVTISLAPLSLLLEGPTTTTTNQPVTLKLTATLNTELPDENPVIEVTYPNNFVFDSATPTPSVGNSIWDISSLTAAKPITIEIKGRLVGQDGDEQVFHAYAGVTSESNKSTLSVVYSSILQRIMIEKPFLEARILVNGQDLNEYSTTGGSVVSGEIVWANNLSTRITDGQIIVSLAGNVFDKTEVDPKEGFYDSANNQIIWDKNSIKELSEINPGEKGTVAFSFKPTSLIGLSLIRDPQVSIRVSIRGRQPTLGQTYTDINNFSEKVVKILTDFQLANQASYLSGSLPPKAETETKYTVTWILSNSANNINQAEARSVLPIYVNYVSIGPNENENVTYNEVTREIIWNIGSVRPNTGIDSNREASFIISIKPSLSQVGSVPQLMKETYLSGIDSFTNVAVKSVRGSLNTSLNNDLSLPPGGGRVQN